MRPAISSLSTSHSNTEIFNKYLADNGVDNNHGANLPPQDLAEVLMDEVADTHFSAE